MTYSNLSVHPSHDFLFMPSLSDHMQLINIATKGIRGDNLCNEYLFHLSFSTSLKPRSKILD